MSPFILPSLAVAGIVVAAAAACAVQILHEFWRHELEDYCLRRGKGEWFSRIIELREKLAVAAQTVQMFGIGVSATASFAWLQTVYAGEAIQPLTLIGLVAAASLILLAANCWIPWAMLNIAAAPYLYRTWRLWWIASLLLAPLTAGVHVASSVFERLAGQQPVEENHEETFEDEFMSMVSEGERGGLLESETRDMIEGVFELDDSIAAKVMTPRSRVEVIHVHSTWEEIIAEVARSGRTRLPVVEDQFNRIDDVIGILFAKDVLHEMTVPEDQRKSLRDLARPPQFVPLSKPLDDMLEQFRRSRSHMAIVVDEYGAISGVITIEDVLEEIVGEIVDENDTEEPGQIHCVDTQSVEVDGVVRLDVLNDELGLNLPVDQDFDTLSGLIMATLGTIPRSGQSLRIGDMQLRILQASRRSIERVKITLLDTSRAS